MTLKHINILNYLKFLNRAIRRKVSHKPKKSSNYHHQLASKKSLLRMVVPTKLELPLPSFTYPQTVNVLISKDQHIDYESAADQSLKSIALTMPFSQFQGYTESKWKISIAQMPLKSVHLPSAVLQYFAAIPPSSQQFQGTSIVGVNLWYYKGHRVTTWHYDGHDNFLFLLKGKKIVSLLPQYNPHLKSKSIFDENNNHASNNPSRLNSLSITLEAGESLFIPRGWWHYVQSEGKDVVGINVWGNSVADIKEDAEEMTLKHLVWQMSQRICSATIRKWDQMDEKVKQVCRRASFLRYLQS